MLSVAVSARGANRSACKIPLDYHPAETPFKDAARVFRRGMRPQLVSGSPDAGILADVADLAVTGLNDPTSEIRSSDSMIESVCSGPWFVPDGIAILRALC
jgi:hypothetical protein